MSTDMTTIYVRLPEEAASRPTEAVALGNGLFKLLPTSNYAISGEVWEFAPGSIVRAEERTHKGNTYLLAVEKIS